MPDSSNLWPADATEKIVSDRRKPAEEFDREYLDRLGLEWKTRRCSLTGTDCTADERTCGGWCGGRD